MKRLITLATLALVLAGPAAAECYADYKAKRDEPLQLHYGVAQVGFGCQLQPWLVLPKANWRRDWRAMAGRY